MSQGELATVVAPARQELARQASPPLPPEVMEKLVVGGDLSRLSSSERVQWYLARCHAAGLDPSTRPFEYLTLDGKLTLYANKGCAEQLRKLHHVSVTALTSRHFDDVVVITAEVRDGTGRTDTSTGAVSLAGLKGNQLANALMRAETKAKRRATLSICGLGMLDESELDTIEAAPPPKPQNQSGHATGQYASPEQVEAYRRATLDFCRERNAQWADEWTGPGGIAEGIADVLHPNQMTYHLLKWALASGRLQPVEMTTDPETGKPVEKVSSESAKKYVAIVFAREPEALAIEAEQYFLAKAEEARLKWREKYGGPGSEDDVYSTEGGEAN